MRIFLICMFLSLSTILHAADIKWPKYLTKKIPAALLNKIDVGSNGEVSQMFKEYKSELNSNPGFRIEFIKILVQTGNAQIMMNQIDISSEEEKIMSKLLKKYVN
tara:strand:- start:378 stop:692 length:315 start_codon:yes stop_codon:yes gene_type:complete